jgi:hypothetical protein
MDELHKPRGRANQDNKQHRLPAMLALAAITAANQHVM